ncbi:hypothetical protein BGZ73_007405 [Actinomortierella ambigua]|nr:hypothetical protein BGZ73_007405 [Actinomortierella ambigua]
MGHTLRLLVNVSHESEVCCEMLAQHDAVSVLTVNIIQLYRHCRQHLHFGKGRHGQSEDDTQDWYDILLLSVGLVINMLEKNAASRSKFLHSAIKLGCPGIGPCFHGNCDCAKSDQALEKIIEIYKPESDAQVEGNMLPAYLAVLIVRIVEDDANGQERLAQAVGDSGLEEMRLLLENFGLMYNAMLETIVERVICDSEDNALASKKENIHTDRMRQTFRSILNTTRVLTNIQNSRMV